MLNSIGSSIQNSPLTTIQTLSTHNPPLTTTLSLPTQNFSNHNSLLTLTQSLATVSAGSVPAHMARSVLPLSNLAILQTLPNSTSCLYLPASSELTLPSSPHFLPATEITSATNKKSPILRRKKTLFFTSFPSPSTHLKSSIVLSSPSTFPLPLLPSPPVNLKK